MADQRTADLTHALAAVRARIANACAAAQREPSEVTLIVVTKTHDAADVRRLTDLGVRDVGENKDQEAAAKSGEWRASTIDPSAPAVRWHMIGQLQSNKVRSVVQWADVVHTLDRPSIVTALDKAATVAGRHLDVLIQVGLDDEAHRGGILPADALGLAEQIAASGSLDLRGVMAVAPLAGDPSEAFDRLALTAERIRAQFPVATWMSAGMSGDLEAAISAGATHVRVGSAVLGQRPPLR